MLGRGKFGEARLVRHNDRNYVAKRSDDAAEKKGEEATHIAAWERMSPGCRRYLCRPI